MSDWSDEDEFYGRVAHKVSRPSLNWDDQRDSLKQEYIAMAKAVRAAKYVDPIAELAKDLDHEYSLGIVDNDNRSRLMLRIALRAYQLGARVKP